MTSLLKQLDSDQAILLMYLADELPAGDRVQVDHRLAADPALRQMLEALRADQSAVHAMVNAGDRHTPLPVSAPVAVRNVMRSIRQWQVDQLRPEPAEAQAAKSLRYPWWIYPSVSAAALFLAFLVWWGNWGHERSLSNNTAQSVPYSPYTYDPEAEAIVSGVASTLDVNEEHVSALMSIDAEVEELASLSQGSDDIHELFETFTQEGI